MRELSHLLGGIPASVTLAVNDKAKALQRAGHDVIALAGGDPDFDTPYHIVEAAKAALEAGHTHYPAPTKGIPELLEAIAAKMVNENGVYVEPRTDIIVTPGSKWALYLALGALINPGDEILYFEPVWVSYPPMIRLNGGTPVPVSLDPADNFAITEERIRAMISPRTKALMVNSPSNPTGRMLTDAEARAITKVAIQEDLYVITDEVYEKLAFDGREHISLAAQPGMGERTLTTNGLSKGYAMTGWRLGWLAGPTPIMKLAGKLHGQAVTSAATFTMVAAIAALQGEQAVVEEMRASYQRRRDFMVAALNEMPGIECATTDGAFYLLPRFTETERDSLELADFLLEEAGIAATPGIAFGSSAAGHLRFSIATAQRELERAAERLAEIAPRL
ncbi:MAG: pyridoxal phosphate-dependent aminotransferase [Candidatus Promineifilaceae bacterium]|nr:pyridoxal phosphate-dependent aminotransferase [Candidatus Promineifilaceae bacterium]